MHRLTRGSLNRWCLAIIATALVRVALMPAHADDVQGLAERIHAEWQLPVSLNRDVASLVLVRTIPGETPLSLTVTFAEKTTGAEPAEPMAVRLPRDTRQTEVRVQIGDWPDGEYLTTISEGIGNAASLVRVLRKQTIPAPGVPDEPQEVRGLTMLFVDDWHVHQREGLTRRVHPAQTFPVTSGMLGKDRPHQNPTELSFASDGTAIMRFYTMDRRRRNHVWWTARSRDLVQWDLEKSSVRPDGADEGAGSKVQVPWRWHDPAGKKARYRLYDPLVDGPVSLREVHVQYSGWSPKPTQWGPVDIAPRSTYPIWRKSETDYVVLTPNPLTTDNHRFTDNDPGEWSDSNDNWGGQWLSADGKTLHFCQARVIPRHDPFRVPYDNIPGSRLLVVWSTRDGLNWQPTYLSAPDGDDPQGLQSYGAYGFWAEGKRLRLAYLWVYDQVRQQVDLELAYSRDSLLWHRFAGAPKLVENGPIGSWNFGLVAPLTAPPLVRGDYVYYLLRSLNRPHFFLWNGLGPKPVDAQFIQKRLGGPDGLARWPFWKEFGSWQALADHLNSGSFTVGIMRHRRDGWVSLGASAEAGSLVTKVLTGGETLCINARTRADGAIHIEVLNADGEPLADYCGANTATFSGDCTKQRVTWKDGSVTQLPAQPVRLRLRLQQADIFALQF